MTCPQAPGRWGGLAAFSKLAPGIEGDNVGHQDGSLRRPRALGKLSTILLRRHRRGTLGGVTALSSPVKQPSSWRSTSGGGWVYNNSVRKAKTEIPDNQRFQYRRVPCVSQPRCWSASD